MYVQYVGTVDYIGIQLVHGVQTVTYCRYVLCGYPKSVYLFEVKVTMLFDVVDSRRCGSGPLVL